MNSFTVLSLSLAVSTKMRRSRTFKAVVVLFLLAVSSVGFSQTNQRQVISENTFSTQNNQVRVAFFDADSTLRVSLSGSVSANSPTDVMLLPGVETQIADLIKDGYLIAIVSNQGGIKAGMVTHETASGALAYTIQLIREKNSTARIQYFDYAEGDGEDRKPGTGMAKRLEKILADRGLAIDWKNSFMVGDSAYKIAKDKTPNGSAGTHFSNGDRLFAENLGIQFVEPTDFFGWRKYGIDVFASVKDVTEFQNLYGANYRCQQALRK